MHHRDVFRRKLAAKELQHPRDGARPRADPLDRFDLAIRNQQQWLEVEHGPDHRLRAAEATAHLEVPERIQQREDAAFGHPLFDGCGCRLERFGLRRNLGQKGDRHRHGLTVDDIDPEAFDRLCTDARRLDRRGKLRAEVDGDAPFIVPGQSPVHVRKLTR